MAEQLNDVELRPLKGEEGVLDSFDQDQNSLISTESEDRRLNPGSLLPPALTAANEIDRNIHSAMNIEGHVGSSSDIAQEEDNEDVDLETQRPLRRLTKTQRVMNVLQHLVPIRQTYERINNGIATGRMQSNVPGRFIGQGTDGVFRNLTAKPDSDSAVKNETNPPTYEEAAADATPEYWETSVIAPIYEDEVFVEGLPVGNIANFVWNALVTVAFQFVGFLLCYLLHTSHAAKHGSRAGLGVTFIFYGWNLVPSNFGSADELPEKYEPKNPNNYDVDKTTPLSNAGIDDYTSDIMLLSHEDDSSNTPYLAYGLIAFGLFMIFKSLVDYFRVKQMERVILHPPNSNPTITTSTEGDVPWAGSQDN